MKIRNSFLFALLILLVVSIAHAQTKNLQQFVQNWPAGYDTTGKHWEIYQYSQPVTHVLTETSLNSFTLYNAGSNVILWNANLGNFNGGVSPWTRGDTIVIIGSIDTAYITNPAGYGDNPNHSGFYWLYSDTISQTTPQVWLPADTLRALPQPIASQVGPNIEISFTNPAQTISDITMYSVLGYWLWADTTGTGTPNAFNHEIAFVPVQGSMGETTLYSHPISGNYSEGQTVVWAYRLVAVPDTGGTSCPGHATAYLSRNSNPLVIVGIEESAKQTQSPVTKSLTLQPNPFTEKVRITYTLPVSNSHVELQICSADGRVVAAFALPKHLATSSIVWTGKNLPPGTYFVVLRAGTQITCEKVIKLK